MATIPRNHKRKIAEIKATATACKSYSLRTEFAGIDVSPDVAWKELETYDFARLTTDDDSKWTVYVHSNLWYELRPQSKETEMPDEFWEAIATQLTELRSVQTADDVVRILGPDRHPEGVATGRDLMDGRASGFFAGGGGDDTVSESLHAAGWKYVWFKAAYYWAMRAPDGSIISYIEGDIYIGDERART